MILLKTIRTLPNVRRKRKPLLFLSACPTRTGRSLFLPVPAKLLLFLMPCVPSDPFSQNPYNKVIPTFLRFRLAFSRSPRYNTDREAAWGSAFLPAPTDVYGVGQGIFVVLAEMSAHSFPGAHPRIRAFAPFNGIFRAPVK